jgi:hypothetical protein
MVFRVRAVLEEFREIIPVKFRGVSHYTFIFTKSIKLVGVIICLSYSHTRTYARTHPLIVELHAMTVLQVLFKSSYFDKFLKC